MEGQAQTQCGVNLAHGCVTPAAGRRAYEQGQQAAYEQARREIRPVAPVKDRDPLLPPVMTPDQFAYWVRGIADSAGGNGQLVSPHLVDKILQAARNLR